MYLSNSNISLSTVKHEAEFYGIMPLGMSLFFYYSFILNTNCTVYHMLIASDCTKSSKIYNSSLC